DTKPSEASIAAEIAAKIEFLTTTEIALKSGKVLVMSELQGAYDSILKENGVHNKICSGKVLKQLIQSEIEGVEFHKSKRVNESERVTIRATRDTAVQLSNQESDVNNAMKTLYDAALYLRKCINQSKKWVFEGSLEGLSKDHYPEELFQMASKSNQYMCMVLEMMMFIRAVRTANWNLHLQSLEKFARYFFVHDRMNYAGMIPLYLAEMKSLKTTDPDIEAEFQSGNWVVNKNALVPFCGLGADNALEHVNRSMKLCSNVRFATGTGQRHRVIHLKHVVQALGSAKVAALPGLHALSGADITGSFAGKGKTTWWKTFMKADEEKISALTNLGTRGQPSADTLTGIEKLVFQVYVPNTVIDNLKELRWWLFRKKHAQSENLPPTPAALWQAINRANYQALVWNLDTVPEPQLPSPGTFGWKSQDEKWVPVTTSLPPAPEAIIQLVKCGCIKTRCSTNRCNCRKTELKCTNLCSCADSGDLCDTDADDKDVEEMQYESGDSDESDS
ncbi:PREDICTED: uncharacterized protein LOC107329879, partial [Acropora digitifera]|uniref:uncharacterized protein LOC107329879 n=1 Tax=Acropora digitifera TaxID=70779 RepID=UPI00077A74B1